MPKFIKSNKIIKKYLKILFYNIFYMYKEKYLKYKTKYLELKNQLGGGPNIIQEGGVKISITPLLSPFTSFLSLFKFKKSPLYKKIDIKRENNEQDKTKEITNAFAISTDKSIISPLIINIGLMSETEFTALIDGLKVNRNIESLYLIINKLSSDNYRRLREAIGQNNKIIFLKIELSGVDTVVPPELIQVLTENDKITGVYFRNKIDINGASALTNLLKTKLLMNFTFHSNTIDPESPEGLELNLNRRINLNLKDEETELIERVTDAYKDDVATKLKLPKDDPQVLKRATDLATEFVLDTSTILEEDNARKISETKDALTKEFGPLPKRTTGLV
jgi:hypothetical protein